MDTNKVVNSFSRGRKNGPMPYLVPELSRMVTEIFLTPLGHTAPRLCPLFFSTQSRVQPQRGSHGLPGVF